MVHQHLVNSVIFVLCNSLVALVAPSVANANEGTLDLSITAEHELIDNLALDLSIPPAEQSRQSEAHVLDLPEQRSQVVSFVKKCAELEAVPLLDLSGQDDKEMFLGINFDGFLGIYARQ